MDESTAALDRREVVIRDVKAERDAALARLATHGLSSSSSSPRYGVKEPAMIRAPEALEALRAAIEAAGPGTVTIGRNALGPTIVITTSGYDTKSEYVLRAGPILAALSAVASERDAAAIRAFGARVWSDTEEVAYQAGVSDTLARLQEPNVREAVARALCLVRWLHGNPDADWPHLAPDADAALTKIAEMLK